MIVIIAALTPSLLKKSSFRYRPISNDIKIIPNSLKNANISDVGLTSLNMGSTTIPPIIYPIRGERPAFLKVNPISDQ